MTAFMASVRNVAEARLALAGGADIIDIKEPAHGALGAVPHSEAAEIVRTVAGRVPTSTTIGDMPLHPRDVGAAIRAAAECGVSVVKVGLFPGDLAGCLAVFKELSGKVRLAAVVFADASIEEDTARLLNGLAHAGISGVIIDTAGKASGGLLDHWPVSHIAETIVEAHRLGLFIGLAGSLQLSDIAALLPATPDILGFRGALCEAGRTGELSPARISQVRQLIPRNVATNSSVHDMLALFQNTGVQDAFDGT